MFSFFFNRGSSSPSPSPSSPSSSAQDDSASNPGSETKSGRNASAAAGPDPTAAKELREEMVSIPPFYRAPAGSIQDSEFLCAGCYDDYGFWSRPSACSFCLRNFCSDCLQQIQQTKVSMVASEPAGPALVTMSTPVPAVVSPAANSLRRLVARVTICQPCLRQWVTEENSQGANGKSNLSNIANSREKIDARSLQLPNLFKWKEEFERKQQLEAQVRQERQEAFKRQLSSLGISASSSSPRSGPSQISPSMPLPAITWTPSAGTSHRAELAFSIAETLTPSELQKLILRLQQLARDQTSQQATPAVAGVQANQKVITRSNVHRMSASFENGNQSTSTPTSASLTTRVAQHTNSMDAQHSQLNQLNSLLNEHLNASTPASPSHNSTPLKPHSEVAMALRSPTALPVANGEQLRAVVTGSSAQPSTSIAAATTTETEPILNAVRGLLAQSKAQAYANATTAGTNNSPTPNNSSSPLRTSPSQVSSNGTNRSPPSIASSTTGPLSGSDSLNSPHTRSVGSGGALGSGQAQATMNTMVASSISSSAAMAAAAAAMAVPMSPQSSPRAGPASVANMNGIHGSIGGGASGTGAAGPQTVAHHPQSQSRGSFLQQYLASIKQTTTSQTLSK